MEAFTVSAGHVKDALVPCHAKQASDAVVKRGALVAMAEVTFDGGTLIEIDFVVDEIRQFGEGCWIKRCKASRRWQRTNTPLRGRRAFLTEAPSPVGHSCQRSLP